MKKDCKFVYDEEGDVLRINNKSCNYDGRNRVDSTEVYPGIWVIYVTGNERCFLTIEILKAKKRDLKPVNDFLEKYFHLTIKDFIDQKSKSS